jgi:hypothetical protein
MKWGSIGIIAVAAVTALSREARADRRAYGETYEAVTAPKGELDVETWHTYATDGEVSGGGHAPGHRTMLELEYGLTDRWDVAFYNMLDVVHEDVGEPFTAAYAGFKVESRYRLALAGQWPVDPVIYVEYQHLFQGDATDKFELKGIVARDLGPWNLAVNFALEVERLSDAGKLNPELEYALGVSREIVSSALKIGVEAFGKLEKPDAQLEKFIWVGPAVSWATSLDSAMSGIWLTLAAGKGLTEESRATYGRAIVGLQF